MTGKSAESEAANGPLYLRYFGWLNRQSMRRRRGQSVYPYENAHSAPQVYPKRRLVMTPVNDLMDPLHGNIELMCPRVHRFTSGISSTDKIVAFFLGEWFFRRVWGRVEKLENECCS
jgi:hypothetical protein